MFALYFGYSGLLYDRNMKAAHDKNFMDQEYHPIEQKRGKFIFPGRFQGRNLRSKVNCNSKMNDKIVFKAVWTVYMNRSDITRNNSLKFCTPGMMNKRVFHHRRSTKRHIQCSVCLYMNHGFCFRQEDMTHSSI